jgi:hypothetical protein
MRESLILSVARVLQDRSIAFAVIGAAALAARGYSRATSDIDLITTNAAVLALDWNAALPGIAFEATPGEADDPLAGLVRFQSEGSDDVDLVIGRWKWQAAAIARADPVDFGFAVLPVVSLVDLVIFKIEAGGPGDYFDVAQLVEIHGEGLLGDVERALPDIDALRAQWRAFREQMRRL